MTRQAGREGKDLLIDCHGHVDWHGYDSDRLAANLDEHGIDVMWLLTWEVPPEEMSAGERKVLPAGQCGLPLQGVLAAARKHPKRFVPFYAPDPRRPESLARFRELVERRDVRGCGELKVRFAMDDARAMELFRYCGQRRLPVIFHLQAPSISGKPDPHWYCGGYETLARVLGACPGTIFLGHAPGFWREISGDAEESPKAYPAGPVTPGGKLWGFLDRFPNLWCDLSAGSGLNAISRDPAAGKGFLLKYQDRCLFGRDYFDDRLMSFLKSCGLPGPALAKILSGNALKLLPLEGASS